MSIWFILLICFAICLLITSIGFEKFVWFLSIGYGLAVCTCGIALAIIFGVEHKLTLLGLIACLLFVFYGFRLGGFLAIREAKNASYRKTLKEATKTEKPMPIFVKITIWLSVSLIYPCQMSGVIFAMDRNQSGVNFFSFNWFELAAVVIMLLGILIEAFADAQKTKFKRIDPKKPAMKGLYKVQRCPNYYGEILFWTGVVVYFLSLVCPYTISWWMWIIVILGYIEICYVMLSGAKRLEKRQAKNYADLAEFQEYTKKTPMIYFLFIPIKSLLNCKFIV